ncbi:ferric-chelate reductase [Pyrenochaeta sp. DS3sAY3a]|nr:ferric-chelate reductase [Pyrenochaeta sp. DS3sAY3a]
MSLPYILVLLSSIFLPAQCYDPAIECINGIRTAIAEFHFAGSAADDYWGSLCTNNLSVPSMWAATKVYCNPKEIEAGSKMLSEYCTEYGEVSLTPYAEVLPTLTDDFITSLELVDYEDFDEAKIWNHSILLSPKLFEAGQRTTSTFEMEYTLHQTLGWAVYGFWGLILSIGMAHRLSTYIFYRRQEPNTIDVESTASRTQPEAQKTTLPTALLAIHDWFRTNLIVPATFGSHHLRPFWGCAIPTRIETTIITLFWILNLILCCVGYEIFSPNLYYTTAIQNWRYISDRTGIIAYANLSLIWMFSGRNNVFIWLTGWNFSTFNVFHRHIARIATIQAIVHSIGYAAIEINFKSLVEAQKEQYWYMGALAIISMTILLLASSIYLRQRAYEVFLLLHVGFSVIVIIGLFYHTAIMDGEYDAYLWPLVAIWSFDRAARLLRLVYCNLHLELSSAPMHTTATASYDENSNFLRLRIVPGTCTLKPKPGQHYYLYQPLRWKGWENHPFTLAAWKTIENSPGRISELAEGTLQEVSGEQKEIAVTPSHETIDHTLDMGPSTPTTQSHSKSNTSRTELTFFIRPFDSWTKRLRDQCLEVSTGSINAHLLIEGPYGERSPIHTFEHVVFIVGGTGIAGALPYLQEFVSATTATTVGGSEATLTRTIDITLLWATKQAALLHDVSTHELRHLFGRNDMQINLYATQNAEMCSTAISGKEQSSGMPNTFEVVYGRPNIRDTITEVIERVHADGATAERIAVLTCGPASMADDSRATVHKALKDGKRNVEYFEEAFGW